MRLQLLKTHQELRFYVELAEDWGGLERTLRGWGRGAWAYANMFKDGNKVKNIGIKCI